MVKKKEDKQPRISPLYKPQVSAQLFVSPNDTKKFRVEFYENGKKKKHVDFGASKYKDYTIYYEEEGKEEADKHREAYIARHKPRENWNRDGIKTAGFWSRWLIWNKPSLTDSIKDIEKRFNVDIIYRG